VQLGGNPLALALLSLDQTRERPPGPHAGRVTAPPGGGGRLGDIQVKGP
jgi:hypothetical protein